MRRRIVISIAASLAIVGMALSAAWFLWLPEYRPRLEPGERYGIDVSHHQGRIDWTRVARDGIEFAYIKATEGGDHVDRRFAENWAGAAAVGLDRGAYHFFTLCRGGEEQAGNFLATVPVDPDGLPPAVDLELAGNCAARPSDTELLRELRAFLEPVESAWARPVVLYIGDDFEARYRVRRELDRPLWHPRFLRRPDVDGWVVWQVMGFAHVNGVSGDVDLDIAAAPQEE